MKGPKGEFLGFTFNNIHSSDLGIFRTQKGLMGISLAPQLKDVTTEINGQDGKHYYGSTYQDKTITIDFAFVDLTDEQISTIKSKWNDKKIHKLIFDEYPYKAYLAKTTGSSVVKHVSFSKQKEHDSVRYYNGEGSFTFTCFFPLAISNFSYIEDYNYISIDELDGFESWAASSGIPRRADGYGVRNTYMNNPQICYYKIKNPGIEKAIIKIWVDISKIAEGGIVDENTQSLNMKISKRLAYDGEPVTFFEINNLFRFPNTEDKYLLLDFYNGVLIGYPERKQIVFNGKKEIYNQYVSENFFCIEPNEECYIFFDLTNSKNINIEDLNPMIEIQYLYN